MPRTTGVRDGDALPVTRRWVASEMKMRRQGAKKARTRRRRERGCVRLRFKRLKPNERPSNACNDSGHLLRDRAAERKRCGSATTTAARPATAIPTQFQRPQTAIHNVNRYSVGCVL